MFGPEKLSSSFLTENIPSTKQEWLRVNINFPTSSPRFSVFGLLVRKIEIRRLVGVSISNKKKLRGSFQCEQPDTCGEMNRYATERADMARPTVAPPFTKATKNVDLILFLSLRIQ